MACCTGSSFAPAPDAALDPSQRVNFTFGMVLGVDDFRQEHAYLAGRDEEALRETIGYGVIRGLDVVAPKPAAGERQQVRVGPGLALTPDGHLVAVRAEQCANLETWLAAEKLRDPTTATRPTVCVVLRYAEQSGTPVPIPGEPCRDESALQADARISDSFSIAFSWTAPDASEDNAVRSTAAWIRAIKVLDLPVADVPMAQFQIDVEAGLRQVIAASCSSTQRLPVADTPRGADPSAVTTPPKVLKIPRSAYASYMNAAFEVWVRLLRSGLMAHHGPVPDAEERAERGLLLAGIDVLSVAGVPAAADLPRVRMLGRPQLLHLRMLQEWLLRDGEQDAPREAHYLLGKANPQLAHAQDLQGDFAGKEHALTRVDFRAFNVDGDTGTKAVLRPAVKWPGVVPADGGPDYYGPVMSQPIPVSDGGTGQAAAPVLGSLLVGTPATGATPAHFVLGGLVGFNQPKPSGSTTNIVVDVSSGAPGIRLDTVQDIGPSASPTFGGLDVTGLLSANSLAVETDANVRMSLSVDGELVLGEPLSSVLATDRLGVVGAAKAWDGDETALAAGATPYIYAPGQPEPVRMEDGGTALAVRPDRMQMLIGVPDPATDSASGHYVLATLVSGKNTAPNLTEVSNGEGSRWELSIDAAGGAATQVLAAGNATSPPSLTAVTTGNRVVIDAVQPVHPTAQPRFNGLNLTSPPERPGTPLLGWDPANGEVVRTAIAVPSPVDIRIWSIRVVRDRPSLVVKPDDHVIVVLPFPPNSIEVLVMPKAGSAALKDGQVIVVKSMISTLQVANVQNGTVVNLENGNSLTLIAATKIDPPQWLVIGRS